MSKTRVALVACGLLLTVAISGWAVPPYGGTIFIDPDIITPSDHTTLLSVTPTGVGSRVMFDRRVGAFVTLEAILFEATFDDGLSAEIQVNPEFGTDAAEMEAVKYARAIGRLPTALRVDVDTVWIHQGVQPFGGGNRNVLIHVGQGELYIADGILEETLVHEATHTSLDATHAQAPGWIAAQNADPDFISTYAEEFPDREDLAETFLVFLAVRHRSDRISGAVAGTINQTVPNRIAYLAAQGFDLYPIEGGGLPIPTADCVRDSETACLLGERFEVSVVLRDFSNPPNGPGNPFPGKIQHYEGKSSETEQSVSFYAFQDGNVEIFVKMVDACSFGGSDAFWLFAAGATNAETAIRVRDTWSGQVYRIDSPRGSNFFFPPDTQAFKTCGFSPPP